MRFFLMVALAGCLAASADAKVAPSVGGSASARSGQWVSFQAHGFPANTRLAVMLSPAQSAPGNCCGIGVKTHWKTNVSGTATLRFRWPNHYEACSGGNNCTATKWAANSTAIVTVSTTSYTHFTAATTTTLVRN
jgi:hypothetical protein